MNYRRPRELERSSIINILNVVSGDTSNIDLKKFLVLECENRIIGCVRIKEINGFFELASLAVLPEYRNQGIGTHLVKEILLIESNKRPIYLLCHQRNQLFYNRLGFSKEDPVDLPIVLNKEYMKFLKNSFIDNPESLVAMVLK